MDYVLRVLDWFYRIVMQLGYSAWSSYNNPPDSNYIISDNTPFLDMLGETKPLKISVGFQMGLDMVYSIICGVPNTAYNIIISGINAFIGALNFIGFNFPPIPSLDYGNYPLLLGIFMALPFWFGILVVAHLIKKIWDASPLL